MAEFITTSEAAEILEVAKTTIHNYIKDGTIKDVKRKRKGLKMFSWLVSRDEIESIKTKLSTEFI